MLRYILPLALLTAVPSMSKAQDLMILEYPIAIPVGDLNSYINEPSFRGFNLGYRHMIDGTRAVGMDMGWQTFFEKMAADLDPIHGQLRFVVVFSKQRCVNSQLHPSI